MKNVVQDCEYEHITLHKTLKTSFSIKLNLHSAPWGDDSSLFFAFFVLLFRPQ